MFIPILLLLSESESDLQAQLDTFHEYCLTWKLKVNTDQTKIVIVGSGRTPQNLSFKYNGSEIEIVKNFIISVLFLAKLAISIWQKIV